MEITLEELTYENFPLVCKIDRSDIPEEFVDTVDTIMEIADYGVEHGCLGHTFAVRMDERYIGVLLLGEAIPWETDPPEMRGKPFYRLMGFVIDKQFRNMGIGGEVLERAIDIVYKDFGVRPIALGVHEKNRAAERFYLRHGFHKTKYREGGDYYFIRY